MARYKFIIQYDGTGFRGWQLQKNERTVQGELELALSKINKDEKIRIHGAGRTDTGVHATGQTAHFDINIEMRPEKIKDALNGNLPRDIKVMELSKVDENFHARFSANKRHYQYRIRTNGFILDRNFTWHTDPLDINILNKTANILIGENDFTSFSKNNEKLEHYRCIVYESIWKEEDQVLNYYVVANRFLHHMVRYLVGTMVEISKGKYEFEDFKNLIKNPKENVHVIKAPPQGLVLTKVDYEIN